MKRDTEFLYLKLVNNLKEQILSGFIRPGDFLLSEFEMAKHYGLSRASVRKSLEILTNEGFVVKKPGQGTMVIYNLPVNPNQSRIFNVLTTAPSVFSDNALPIIIDAFKLRYPNVDVRVINIPVHMFWENVMNFEKIGLHPDILLVTDSDIKNMEYSGSFIDLSEPLKGTREMFYSKLLDTFCSGTIIQAVPVTFSTVYLAYNPYIFNLYNVPEPTDNWTITDFVNAAQQLTKDTDGDGIIDLYGFSMMPILTRWLVLALQNGVDFSAPDCSEDSLIKTLCFIHDIIYRKRCASLYHPTGTGFGHFFNEKAAMTLTSSLEIVSWKNNQINFDPKVAPLPFGDINATLLITNSFMIPSSTHSKPLAYSFLQTAFRQDIQEKICRYYRFPSVYKAVNEKVWNKSYLQSLNITNKYLDSSFFLHEILSESIAASEIELEMEMYWDGLESAASMAKRILDIIRNR